jgi:RNA polymerase sigma-70 factor, ECF subfamily
MGSVARFVSEEAPALSSQQGEDDERAFVEALKRQDRIVQVRFYDRYADLVERIIARIVGVDDELPDLVHEAFMRALKAMQGLRNAEAITTWMTQIATRTAMDALRRRQTRRKWFSFRTSPQPEIAVLEEPEGALDAQIALRLIYEILRDLPPEERAAFVLRRMEGGELGDVAAACGCSLATVKRRIARAEKTFFTLAAQNPALRECLSRKGGDE